MQRDVLGQRLNSFASRSWSPMVNIQNIVHTSKRSKCTTVKAKRKSLSKIPRHQPPSKIGHKKNQWTKEEDEMLRQLVKEEESDRSGKWAHVADFIPNRSSKQCRERWHNHLASNLKKGGWTAEEDEMIIELQASMGNRWHKITKYLPNRTDNDVKNRWHSMTRTENRKIARNAKVTAHIPVKAVDPTDQDVSIPHNFATSRVLRHVSVKTDSPTGQDVSISHNFATSRVLIKHEEPSPETRTTYNRLGTSYASSIQSKDRELKSFISPQGNSLPVHSYGSSTKPEATWMLTVDGMPTPSVLLASPGIHTFFSPGSRAPVPYNSWFTLAEGELADHATPKGRIVKSPYKQVGN